MLTILSYIFLSIIIIPLILILLILAFGFSFIARIIRPRYPESKYQRSRYPGQKPKGTIEVLPAETEDSELEEKLDKLKGNVKDRRVGKDKFREL